MHNVEGIYLKDDEICADSRHFNGKVPKPTIGSLRRQLPFGAKYIKKEGREILRTFLQNNAGEVKGLFTCLIQNAGQCHTLPG